MVEIDALVRMGAMVMLVALLVPLAMTLYRMVIGPSYADRFVALDMLTGLAVSMAGLTAVATGRREFLDVGFGLAVFGFMGTAALAAFLEKKGRGRQ